MSKSVGALCVMAIIAWAVYMNLFTSTTTLATFIAIIAVLTLLATVGGASKVSPVALGIVILALAIFGSTFVFSTAEREKWYQEFAKPNPWMRSR
jgi:hypothetical protein